MDIPRLAIASGYKKAYQVIDDNEFSDVLDRAKLEDGPLLIEVKVAMCSRSDLGRPTNSPAANKQAFMDFLSKRR
jgi:phosphonopyruvate decarboxylase